MTPTELTPARVRVVLAEDGALLRVGLESLLERLGFVVLATVGDASALIEATETLEPDLVITDIRMPPSYTDEGIRAAVTIRTMNPDLPVVALSQYVDRVLAAELLESGNGTGIGYLLKDRVVDIAQFAERLHRIHAGSVVIDPDVVQRMLRRSPISRLTGREREVLGLLALGDSNASIAEKLFVTEASVTKHTGNIFTKLDLPPDSSHNRRVLAVLTYLNQHAHKTQ